MNHKSHEFNELEESRKNRKKDLGIFYTDERIVNFIFDVLLLWKEKEDEKTHRWNPPSGKPKYPSVIDPACGDGGFLKAALSKNFTKPKYIWGIDIDEEVKKKWEDINLLKSFGSKAELDNHFIHQNGLLSLPDKRVRYKRNGLEEFDCVVGNPPYGGIGVKPKKTDPETQNLLSTLREYEIFSYRKRNGKEHSENRLFKLEERKTKFPLMEIAKMAQGMPIEVLFIERFIQLAKPGGYIAMIIPDGVLANANLDYVRKFIADNTKIMGIVSLPRGAFKHCGTSAKTSILFLKKLKPKDLNYHVLLANVTEPEKGNDLNYLKEVLDFIFNYYKEVYPMNPKPNVARDKIVYHDAPLCTGPTTVWVTKFAKDMAFEKPSSRLDPHYWLPEYEMLFTKFPIKKLGDFVVEIRQGDTARKHLGEKYLKDGIPFLSAASIKFTGIDLSEVKYISKKQNDRLARTRIKTGDIIFGMIGVAGVGRIGCLHQEITNANINCTVDLIRVRDISPKYVVIYLKSKYGIAQIERIKSGVGPPAMNNDEICSIRIPIVSQDVQESIEKVYDKFSIYHDKAMKAKSKGDEADYRKNTGIAEKMLKDLIVRTEAVIRGEQKDIV